MTTKSIQNGDNFKVLGTVKGPEVVEEIKGIFTMSKQERFAKLAQELREEMGIEKTSALTVVPMRVVK